LPATPFTPLSTEEGVSAQGVPETATTAADIVNVNILQLRLLYHYTTVTGPSLRANADAAAVWALIAVQTAFGFPYLLHVVLALASLHLSRLENPFGPQALEYLLLDQRHYDAALSQFQATVCDINNTNCQAVLMFTALMFPYLCVATVDAAHDVEHTLDNLLSNLALTRKMRPMVSSFYNVMQASEISKLIPENVRCMDWTTASPPATTELVELRSFPEVMRRFYPSDIVNAYSHAILILEITFVASARSDKSPSDALLRIWLQLVTDRYIELLSERQPGALIVYAHYAVLVKRSSHCRWYLEGVAEQILRVADALVPAEWSGWLKWPRSRILGASNCLTPDRILHDIKE
jgi:hypothetical protein